MQKSFAILFVEQFYCTETLVCERNEKEDGKEETTKKAVELK